MHQHFFCSCHSVRIQFNTRAIKLFCWATRCVIFPTHNPDCPGSLRKCIRVTVKHNCWSRGGDQQAPVVYGSPLCWDTWGEWVGARVWGGINAFAAIQFETTTINQCDSLVWSESFQVDPCPSFLPKLTLHCDLNSAVLLSHIIACCAPVDPCAVHGEIPQGHNLWVLEIWNKTQLMLLIHFFRILQTCLNCKVLVHFHPQLQFNSSSGDYNIKLRETDRQGTRKRERHWWSVCLGVRPITNISERAMEAHSPNGIFSHPLQWQPCNISVHQTHK